MRNVFVVGALALALCACGDRGQGSSAGSPPSEEVALKGSTQKGLPATVPPMSLQTREFAARAAGCVSKRIGMDPVKATPEQRARFMKEFNEVMKGMQNARRGERVADGC